MLRLHWEGKPRLLRVRERASEAGKEEKQTYNDVLLH